MNWIVILGVVLACIGFIMCGLSIRNDKWSFAWGGKGILIVSLIAMLYGVINAV